MDPIQFDVKLLQGVSLNGEREDVACAVCLADITANWGRLEYGLYWILAAIDLKRGPIWTEEFISGNSTSARRSRVRAIIVKEIIDARLHEELDKLLERFGRLCDERNLLAHAIWRRIGAGQHELVPLQRERGTKVLRNRKLISHTDLRAILREIDFVGQHFAAFASELMAHQFLEGMRRKKVAAAERERAQKASRC